jgi:hypothetical protein
MNCREAERRIYLYTELSSREREQTDLHIDKCVACKQLSDRAKTLRELTSATATPEPPDPAAMTRRIMNAVQESTHRRTLTLPEFLRVPYVNAVRYGMAALSLLLVFSFEQEYNRGVQVSGPVRLYHSTGPAVLNTMSFGESLKTAKERNNRTSSLYECITKCVQAQDAICSDCRIAFTKSNQTP